MRALVNSKATMIFVNQGFVNKHWLNIHKLSHSILVYNVGDISNKDGQINEIVDIVLCYKTYPE